MLSLYLDALGSVLVANWFMVGVVFILLLLKRYGPVLRKIWKGGL